MSEVVTAIMTSWFHGSRGEGVVRNTSVAPLDISYRATGAASERFCSRGARRRVTRGERQFRIAIRATGRAGALCVFRVCCNAKWCNNGSQAHGATGHVGSVRSELERRSATRKLHAHGSEVVALSTRKFALAPLQVIDRRARCPLSTLSATHWQHTIAGTRH